MRKLGIAAVTAAVLGAGYVTARTASAQAPERGTRDASQGRWFDVLTLAGPGSEIAAGDAVVVVGAWRLSEGQPVRIIQQEVRS